MWRQTISIGGATQADQEYRYDSLNRVTVAAEKGTTGFTPAQGTQYVVGDDLESTRLAMTVNSPTPERHDYQPFGYEISQIGGTWRQAIGGYGVDTIRQMFTGQERDNESSLDYFNARYFTGAQGRFTSPDPANAGASLTDPQSWNGYGYVSNNPLTLTDPDGLGIFGDIGSIVGSLIPGVGTLIGWGVGSIADLATGQSISPPGVLGAGINIVGTIAGGANHGQPWNEQLPIGGGMGPLNTGTVFGSGNTGPFIFSALEGAQLAQCASDFGKSHSLAAGLETITGGRVSQNNFVVSTLLGNDVSAISDILTGRDRLSAGIGEFFSNPSPWNVVSLGVRLAGSLPSGGAPTATLGMNSAGEAFVKAWNPAKLAGTAAFKGASKALAVFTAAKFVWDLGTFTVGTALCQH